MPYEVIAPLVWYAFALLTQKSSGGVSPKGIGEALGLHLSHVPSQNGDHIQHHTSVFWYGLVLQTCWRNVQYFRNGDIRPYRKRNTPLRHVATYHTWREGLFSGKTVPVAKVYRSNKPDIH